MNPFVGEIRLFAGSFAPSGWALCDGQLLAVSQNDALFSLLGTIYGGDGRTTFALPDCRGRLAAHMGTGPGLSGRNIGQKAGQEAVTVTTPQLPAHNHARMKASTAAGTTNDPAGNVPSNSPSVDLWIEDDPAVALATQSIEEYTGGGLNHPNLMPFQCINFIIALYGIYPSRN